MNLLSHKPKEDSLNTLDEKQIQERLYGTYHKGSNSVSPAPRTAPPPPPALKESVPDEKKVDIAAEWKALAGAWAQAFRHYGALFPWKMVGSIGIALIGAVLIVQSISGWFANRKFQDFAPQVQEASPRSKPAETAPSVSASSQKTALSSAGPSVSNAGAAVTNRPEAKQKFYAVQICTYQRSRDAEELVKQLQQLRFSAFYKQSFSQAERIPLYVVFLDRVPTYAQAKTQLAEFRKTELFQKFSDSFIQSL